jgi:NTE family protein
MLGDRRQRISTTFETRPDLSASSKLLPTPAILAGLKAAGRDATDLFLATHDAELGKRGTVDPMALLD